MNDSPETPDLPWVDVAKAVCIFLVVLMHAELQIEAAGWVDHEKIAATWRVINEFLRPMRMPTFFLVSGVLAAASLRRDDPDARRKRYVRPLYLYMIWAAVFALLLPVDPAAAGQSALARLEAMVLLGSPAWFLFGLGLFYLVAKATRDMPAALVLGGCAVVSVLGSIYAPDQTLCAPRLLRCAIFFVAGVRLREPVVGFVEDASALRAATLVAFYAVGSGVAARLGTHLLPVDVLAVAASLTALNVLYRNLGALTGPVQWLGRRTLFVYLLHFPLIGLLSMVVGVWAAPSVLENAWLAFLYPVAITILVVPAALALGLAMKRAGLGMLFDLPDGSVPEPAAARLTAGGNPPKGAGFRNGYNRVRA